MIQFAQFYMILTNPHITPECLPVMLPSLRKALGLNTIPRVAFVGSGGKTTALFYLAREYPPPVIVTATSHLEFFQTKHADQHFYFDEFLALDKSLPSDISGVTLFSGPKNNRSVLGLEAGPLNQILSLANEKNAPLLIEADGSRRHPLKAPAAHEPPIPDFVDTVVVVAGMSALGKPCTSEWVHHPEIYANLSGTKQGDSISLRAMENVLCHPSGGLKNIPTSARKVAFLNQADSPELCEQANELAVTLLSNYQCVIVASLKNKNKITRKPEK
jgi:molybdenum cofactor cytidylyltransferase